MLTRRQFARRLAAASLSLPFLNLPAFAASAPAKRLVLIWSLGTDNTLWRPTSAPGAALALPACTAPLSKVADHIVMADGLSFLDPFNQHSTWLPFTGVTSSSSPSPGSRRGTNVLSADQYVLAKQPATTRFPFMSLGVAAKNEGLFFNNNRLAPQEDPAVAFSTFFAGASSSSGATSSAQTSTLPRQAILDQAISDIKAMESTLGSSAKQRLDQHIQALTQLEKGAAPLTTGGACMPALPGGIGSPGDNNFALQNGVAHYNLIAQAFACDLTRIATMQWGISNNAPLDVSAGTIVEEHSDAVHAPSDPKLIQCESALCGAFADFVALLQATPDPSGQGSLLDNTLIFWTRDMGQARAHTMFAVPTVLAGATGYLATKTGGNYVRMEGDDASSKKSAITHDAMLFNCLEWMGVQDMSSFGMAGGASAPLPNIKRS